MKSKYALILIFLVALFINCESKSGSEENYSNQIGDTQFKEGTDVKDFEFCDSTNVLHKRAYVGYTGGTQTLLKEFENHYDYSFTNPSFNGFFIVRLAVNCNGIPGRYRIESHDLEFNALQQNEDLENYILSVAKRLKNWKKPYYRGKFYDGYTFFIIKIKNGKLENYEI